uniref:Uncharacterized protein n=1 Tax=Anguilla anguilla TaxID=7936 RepID=A0A0E9W4Z9_ANGAN
MLGCSHHSCNTIAVMANTVFPIPRFLCFSLV